MSGGNVKTEAESGRKGERERQRRRDTAGSEKRRSHQARTAGDLWKLEKATEQVLPKSLQKEHGLACSL